MNGVLNSLKKPKVLIGIGVVIVIVAGVLWAMQYRISVRNEGEAIQERVEQTYQNAQNALSACLDQGRIAAQVTEQEFESLKEVLQEAVSARYVTEDGPTRASGVLGGGQLISAIQEAYPQIDQRSFQNLQAVVVGCRDEYQGSQDRIFNEARELETWQQTDNLFNQGIKDEFPTSTLDVIDLTSGEVLTGRAALDYMSRVIMVGEARTAYQEGELDEQDLFGNDN